MTKQEFLTQLEQGLSGLPQSDRAERVDFYREMIEDRMEDGMTEAEAVAQMGNVSDIISQIISDTPISKLIKERVVSNKKPSVGVIVLLILGSPIWLSLLIAAAAIVLSFYVVLWSLVISLWAVFVACAVSSVGGVIAGIVYAFSGFAPTGIWTVGVSLVLAGCAILLFYLSKLATKGAIALAKAVLVGIKKSLLKKENA
ncbi:MAG: DUF1700 domain-containing protein [Clostridia bacterium]|nr:DUF1700 domain-containing protein [Clostridia bacterium]